MCGTYVIRKSPREVRSLLSEGWHPVDIPDDAWRPSYKIKPSEMAPVLLGIPSAFRMLSWGFLPHWMAASGKAQINAKSETVAEKPLFRGAIKHTRCLVLADGFYEPKGRESPRPWHFFERPGSKLLGFAGIFTYRERDKPETAGFAILTTTPNSDVAPIHDRMPVILPMAAWDHWLDAGRLPEEQTPLYPPPASLRLNSWPVPDDAKRRTSADGPNCIRRSSDS